MHYHVVVVFLKHEEKTELWVKDASNKRLLVEAWGKAFAAQLRQLPPHAVVCLLNFSVKTEGLPSVTLTGEHAGQSERGSALVVGLAVFDGERAHRGHARHHREANAA